MKRIHQAVIGAAFGTAVTLFTGCSGNIALVGRPTLQLDQEEIFAEIVRVDAGSREIYLRPDDGRDRVVNYSADARVIYRGQAYPITRLASATRSLCSCSRTLGASSLPIWCASTKVVWN